MLTIIPKKFQNHCEHISEKLMNSNIESLNHKTNCLEFHWNIRSLRKYFPLFFMLMDFCSHKKGEEVTLMDEME